MVPANELRLGNYLFNNCRECETIIKVTSIDNHQIGCGIEGVRVNLCYKFENYYPIPLTAELFARFAQAQLLKIESINGLFCYTGNGQFVTLNYLHQLQNLYFAITGEELPVDHGTIAGTSELIQADIETAEY